MSTYDLRKHPWDMQKLIWDCSNRYWLGAVHNLKTMDLIVMDIRNYSRQGFMVFRYEPNFGKIEWPLQNSYLRSVSEAADSMQTNVIDKMKWPPSSCPFDISDPNETFVLDHIGEISHSYTQVAVNPNSLNSFGTKKELALYLVPPTFTDPKIVLMIKQYVGGDFYAGISMSNGNWLSNSGYLPSQDDDGSGICKHILNIHTNVCKVSSGDPVGSEISVTLDKINVKVKAANWSSFTIQDA